MSQETGSSKMLTVAKLKPSSPWLIASVAAALILLTTIGLMLLFGLLPAAKDDSGIKALAASLGIIGAVLSAVVTLIGIVFKYSIDDRNARTAAQAQQSNRIDVAIRAVNLLCENNDDTTKHQIGGALLALVSLGELELAVSLLGELWPDDKLASAHVPEVVLAACLREGSDIVKENAALVLFQNATRIQSGPTYYMWPLPDLRWNPELTPHCRYSLALAAAEWLIAALERDPDLLPHAAVVLHDALAYPDVNEIAASCLRPLQELPHGNGAGTPTHFLMTEDIAGSLKDHPEVTDRLQSIDLGRRVQAALAHRDGSLSQSDQGSNN